MEIVSSIPGITVEAASAAALAAVNYAKAHGWKVNVAVVDRGGNLMAFLRMPGAFIHSINIAIDKAYTCASFGFPTKQWVDVIGDDEGMKVGFSNVPRLVVFGGGVPILAGDDWIGGIGVSGASAEEDEECARAGLEALSGK